MILQSIIFGVILTILLILVSKLVGPIFCVDIPKECASWNDKHAMEITSFLGGVGAFLIAGYVGIIKV